MSLSIKPVDYETIAPARDLYRHDAGGIQLVRDSVLRRGFGQAFAFEVDGRFAGYGGVGVKYDPGRICEFYLSPAYLTARAELFSAFVAAADATEIVAQTNHLAMYDLLLAFGTDPETEALLFEDDRVTSLAPAGATLRKTREYERASLPVKDEPVGDWVVELDGVAAGTGGFFTHYNPPYADVFLEIFPNFRRRGLGAFLVQEAKRAAYEAGRKPAARCGPENVASRKTMEKAGFRLCGELVVAKLRR